VNFFCSRMAQIISVTKLILEKLILKYKHQSTSVKPTVADIVLADEIVGQYEALFYSEDYDIEHTLDFSEDGFCEFTYEDQTDDLEYELSESSFQDSQSSQEWQFLQLDEGECFELPFIQKVLNFYDSIKHQKFQKTQNRYPRVKHHSYIVRFRKYAAESGTKTEKMGKLEAAVLNQFRDSRSKHMSVHTIDIRRWAVIEAKRLNLPFSASSTWCKHFQKRYRIVGRTITKFVTTKDITTKMDIIERARLFVESTKQQFSKFQPSEVYNADQSPCTYELVPKRTLSNKGERITYGFVNSVNKITHSYSIMPIISMNGKLLSPIFLCLQEKDGKFGPRVIETIDQMAITYPNVYVTCTKSGKLDKNKMREWVTGCLNPNIEEKCLLLLDAWTGQSDSKLYEEVQDRCTRLEIPAKTTDQIQPLDRYFFRQYKILRKRIWERLQLDGLSEDFHKRENIVKMHSVIHNQFSSPKFEDMIKHAWSDCGYMEKSNRKFQNVLEVCFPPPTNDNILCEMPNCSEAIFIRCSYCSIYICINHFYKEHVHM